MGRIRHWQPGDDVALSDLRNRSLRGFAGWVPRSPATWNWSFIRRPDVGQDGVLVFEQDAGQPAGYAVLTRRGIVLEFIVSPDDSEDERYQVARSLVAAVEEQAQSLGVEAIEVTVSSADRASCRALSELAYGPREQRGPQWTLVDVKAFLEAKLSSMAGSDQEQGTGFRLEIADGTTRLAPYQQLWVRLSPVLEVTAHEPAWVSDVVISTDMRTLTRVSVGDLSAQAALNEGSVAVKPLSASNRAAALLAGMALSVPWFTPPSDVR